MTSWQILARSVSRYRGGERKSPVSGGGLQRAVKNKHRALLPLVFLFGRLLYVSPKGVSTLPALGRRAHAVPPEAMLNWLAQGHCWQHGCPASRLRWAPKPATAVGERFRVSLCYVSCSGYALSRSWTSLGKSRGTAVIILSRHNLRNALRESGCTRACFTCALGLLAPHIGHDAVAS